MWEGGKGGKALIDNRPHFFFLRVVSHASLVKTAFIYLLFLSLSIFFQGSFNTAKLERSKKHAAFSLLFHCFFPSWQIIMLRVINRKTLPNARIHAEYKRRKVKTAKVLLCAKEASVLSLNNQHKLFSLKWKISTRLRKKKNDSFFFFLRACITSSLLIRCASMCLIPSFSSGALLSIS